MSALVPSTLLSKSVESKSPKRASTSSVRWPVASAVALKNLDQAIFNRPKSGFVLPIERWCRSELQEELNATFADRTRFESIGINQEAAARLWRAFQRGAPGVYWSRVWSLFVLSKWCEMHCVEL